MAQLFTPEYAWLWAAALAIALFFPVRRMIWVLYVRRAERDGQDDEIRRGRLHRRAGITSALLCLVFSALYTMSLFGGSP